MVIANPIYDTAFKLLMENEKAAKFFIGTLLDETIVSIEAKPQEYNYFGKIEDLGPEELKAFEDKVRERLSIWVYRLDFIATIKTATGEHKKVLIEIQKAKKLIDVMRFRNYLAEQYKKQDVVNGKKKALPITTIYMLGFNLPEIATACLKVERNYKDLISQKIIKAKSDFVESLTHTSYIVQVRRIKGGYQTRLDKLLSIFEQANFIGGEETTKEFNHDTDTEDVKLITDILHYAGTDPAEKKKIEDEQEAWRTIEDMYAEWEANLVNELKEKEIELEEKDKALTESKKENEEKDKALTESRREGEEKDRALAESKRENEENKKALNEMARQLEEFKRMFGKK